MAGDNSTTEPPMLDKRGRDLLYDHIFFSACAFTYACPFLSACAFLCVRIFLCYSLIIICAFSCADNKLHRTGIEPGSIAWQATILPLNHRSLTNVVGTYSIIIYFSLRAFYPLCACFSLLFSDNNLRIFRAQIISCIGRESNPGLSRGRRQFYHSTTDA